MSKGSPTITIRMSKEHIAWVKSHAESRGITVSDFFRELVLKEKREVEAEKVKKTD